MRTKRTAGFSAALGACLLLLPLTASAFYNPTEGRWLSRDPMGENGGEAIYAFLEDDPIDGIDFIGLVKVKKDKRPFTQALQQQGVWGWTSFEGDYSIEPAKLKDQVCGPCKVTRKPELTFSVVFIVVKSGKQKWRETAVFDGTRYPNSDVYISSAIASFSERHEGKRFSAWETAFTGFFGPHYEDAAAAMTAPTCDELKRKIEELFGKAWKDFDNNSPEKQELERALITIGQEGISVARRVRRSGFGNVRIEYDESR